MMRKPRFSIRAMFVLTFLVAYSVAARQVYLSTERPARWEEWKRVVQDIRALQRTTPARFNRHWNAMAIARIEKAKKEGIPWYWIPGDLRRLELSEEEKAEISRFQRQHQKEEVANRRMSERHLLEYLSSQPGRTRLIALVNGDETIQLSSLEISGQGRRVVCTDAAMLRYFESCLRSSIKPGLAGTPYELTCHFADGSQHTSQAFVSEDGCVELHVDWWPGKELDPPTKIFRFSTSLPDGTGSSPLRAWLEELEEWRPDTRE